MDFLGITSSETVRGVLGVEKEELPDSVFTDTNFSYELQILLEGWLPETISTVCSKAVSSQTGYDTKLKLLKLCAQYAGALVISTHLNLGIAQQTSDGQNTFKRREKSLKEIVQTALARAEEYKAQLLEAYNETAAATPVLFGSASPTYDPVLGEDT